MLISLHTNPAVNGLLRQMRVTETEMARTTERLATGKRINRAADGPADLTRAQRLRAQLASLAIARDGLLDAQGMADVADSALGSIDDALTAIRDLAVRYQNDTLSAADRAALQQEADQLWEHIQTVRATTSFSDIKLLDGTGQDATFITTPDGTGAITVHTVDVNELIGQDAPFDLSQAGVIDTIDQAVEAVNAERAAYGAIHNLLGFAAQALDGQYANLDAARSRIEDADMAFEAAKLTRLRIQQQAQAALLAQANTQPQMVLKLLGSD
jgi:flagellin